MIHQNWLQWNLFYNLYLLCWSLYRAILFKSPWLIFTTHHWAIIKYTQSKGHLSAILTAWCCELPKTWHTSLVTLDQILTCWPCVVCSRCCAGASPTTWCCLCRGVRGELKAGEVTSPARCLCQCSHFLSDILEWFSPLHCAHDPETIGGHGKPWWQSTIMHVTTVQNP